MFTLTLPYQEAGRTRVRVEPWSLADGPSKSTLPEVLPDWDYSMNLTLVSEIEIDIDGLREDCKLAPEDKLRAVVTWASGGTGLRELAWRSEILPSRGGEHMGVAFQVAAAKLAGDVRLSVRITLAETIKPRSPFGPRLAGSTLWSSESKAVLEGIAGRFPVAVVEFSNAGWLAGEAGWYLDWDRSDFERPALGALRLLLNQQHRIVVDAVTARNPTDGQRAVLETIRYDVAKTLTTAALRSVDFLDGAETFADGSVGRELVRLLKAVLPEESPRTAAAILEEDPSRFDCELQASLRLLWNPSSASA